MGYFTHMFRRPVKWRGHVIVGLIVQPHRASILDEHGRELRWFPDRHL